LACSSGRIRGNNKARARESPRASAVPATARCDGGRSRRGRARPSARLRRGGRFPRPTSVSITSPGRRSTTVTPSVRSRSRICIDSAGWVTEQASAGAAEMAVAGQRREITKLPERDHLDQIN
jgi:hypothetical protein